MREYRGYQPQSGGLLAGEEGRSRFVILAHLHFQLSMAIFCVLEAILAGSGLAEVFTGRLGLPSSEVITWTMIILFVLNAWICLLALRFFRHPLVEYGALVGFPVAQAVILFPAFAYTDSLHPGFGVIGPLELFVAFGVLSGIAFFTRRDSTMYRRMVTWFPCFLVLLLASTLLFGYDRAWLVGVAGIAGFIVFLSEAKVMDRLPEERYVAAAVILAAAPATAYGYALFPRDMW